MIQRVFKTLAATLLASAFLPALAGDEYNTVPAGDIQYRQCMTFVNKLYTGGDEKSPIRGQTKAQAWCTCLWNETPDDFKGSLLKFSESPGGKKINKVCEKYSNWG